MTTGNSLKNTNPPVVLITGTSGFVGRHVAPILKHSGWNVRPASRKPSSQDGAVLIDSIGPTTKWDAALSGVDAVVHLAGRVHHPNEEHASDIYQSLNVGGTLHLAECAANAGVREFIYISTALVNGDSTTDRAPFRENDVLKPRGVYGRSKAAAEAGLEALAKKVDMNITVLRPPLIYGDAALGNFRILLNAVMRGIPLPFGSIQNKRAFLAVENLASFIAYRLAHPGGKFDTYLIADAEQVSTPAFIRKIAESCGKPTRLIPMPVSLLKLLFRLTGRPEAINSVIGSMEIDGSKILTTGWRPPLTLSEGLARAVGQQPNRSPT
jgi:UDP-glucose 4-epimerase